MSTLLEQNIDYILRELNIAIEHNAWVACLCTILVLAMTVEVVQVDLSFQATYKKQEGKNTAGGISTNMYKDLESYLAYLSSKIGDIIYRNWPVSNTSNLELADRLMIYELCTIIHEHGNHPNPIFASTIAKSLMSRR